MAASPLLGYNTNVRHLGKLYHIQTEDSGSSHGHIFTHLFADGGRIIASKKTTYSQFVGTARYPAVVKQLMRESHKAMFIALRDGLFDEDEAAGAKAMTAMQITLPDEAEPAPAEPDVEALERAAAAKLAESAAGGRYQSTKPAAPSAPPAARLPARPAPVAPSPTAKPSAPRQAPAAQAPAAQQPAAQQPASQQPFAKPPSRPDPQSESIFGGDLLSEKSLDEVILSYLAEDVDE